MRFLLMLPCFIIFAHCGNQSEEKISVIEEKPLSKEVLLERTIPVSPPSTTVTIDGALTEACWSEITPVELIDVHQKRVSTEPAHIRFAVDDSHLYVAVNCREDFMNNLDADILEDDNPGILRDDYIGFFFRSTTDPAVVYQLHANPNGAILDAVAGADPGTWTSGAVAKARLDAESWSMEISLPLKALGISGDTHVSDFGVNVSRLKQTDGSQHSLFGDARDLTQPDAFARLFRTSGSMAIPVSGRIVRSDGTPVRYATITLGGQSGIVTDVEGIFQTTMAHPGETSIQVFHPAYKPVIGVVDVQGDRTTISDAMMTSVNPYQISQPVPDYPGGYHVMAVNPLFPVLPDTPLPPGDDAVRLQVAAARGEYEPLSFAVITREKLDGVQVEMSGMINPAGDMLSPDEWTVRLVDRRLERPWYYSPPEASVFTSRYLFPYLPFDLPANSFRQVWLTVHVPADQPAGDYAGRITVKPQNGTNTEIPVKLTVYPFTLQKPDKWYGGYYYGIVSREERSADSAADPTRLETAYRQEIADMQEHGINLLLSLPAIGYRMTGSDIAISYDRIIKDMERRQECGFSGPMVVNTGFESLVRLLGYDRDPDTGNLDTTVVNDQRFHDISRRAMEGLRVLQKERGWPELAVTHMDEVFNAGRLPMYIILSNAVRQVPGFRLFMAHSAGNLDKMALSDPYIDIRNYHGRSLDDWWEEGNTLDDLSAMLQSSGDEAWLYYNIRSIDEHPIHFRLVNGAFLWTSPVKGHAMWGISYYNGNPFDAMDGNERGGVKNDYGFFFPSQEDRKTPVPTLCYEAFREGIDDTRYYRTLETAILQARTNGAASGNIRAAEGLLKSIRQTVVRRGPSVQKLVDSLEPEWCDVTRSQVAEIISRLRMEQGK